MSRTIDSVMGDPQASPEDVLWLAGQAPPWGQRLAVRHPNCPLDFWWMLVRDHPIDAIRSPVYDLVLLDDPGKWKRMEQDNANHWARYYAKLMSPLSFRLLAVNNAEHLLGHLSLAPSDLGWMSRYLALSRKVAEGQLSLDRLNIMILDQGLWPKDYATSAWQFDPLRLVKEAVIGTSYVHERASWIEGIRMIDDYLQGQYGSEVVEKERVWRWRNLLSYIPTDAHG